MGFALVKLKIMPKSPDTDLDAIKSKGEEEIKKFEGSVTQVDEEPVAFGLKALIAFIRIPEDKDTGLIEESFSKIEGVSSVDIIDYRREV